MDSHFEPASESLKRFVRSFVVRARKGIYHGEAQLRLIERLIEQTNGLKLDCSEKPQFCVFECV
jgi:hypothetical protein